jgi:diguanylate cyclase (GGDEF)-like protein/putative nucleotidyltransferase with HDIG domain
VLLILTIVFISNLNGVQFAGPSSFLYWTCGLLTFLVPTAYVTQWLAKRFPGQGGIYLWAIQVLGPQWGFISAFCAWLSGTIAVVSAVEGCTTFIQYLAPTWFTHPLELCGAIIVLLCLAAAVTVLPLRILVRVLLAVTVLYLGVCITEGIAGGVWLLQGHRAAVSLTNPAQWQLNSNNIAVYGIVILALLGVNTPLVMGGEIRGGNAGAIRARHYVWLGIGLSFLAYIAGTFGVMMVVPASQAGMPAANIQVIQLVFGNVAGSIASVLAALGYFGITIAYILMFSRFLYSVAKNSNLPAVLTRLNRRGVPLHSIFVQTGIIATVAVLCYAIVPTFFSQFMKSDDLALATYNVLQAAATIIWVVSCIQLFALPLVLAYRNRKPKQRQSQRVRTALLLLMSCTGIIASVVALWDTISSSWISNLISNDHWAIIVLGVTFLVLAAGWLSSELPRAQSLLKEQRRVNSREVALRAQLETAHQQLQESHGEQEILIEQQKELLAEVGRLYREQAQAAVTDAITGLPNHRAIMSQIDEELAHCEQASSPCTMLFVDIDHFKCVNDTWGHRAGDAILREVAARLRTTIRFSDFVGRYGGEEFALLLPETDIVAASETAERLRLTIGAHPCVWQSEDGSSNAIISITASIGVASYGIHGTTREMLVERADHAMYRAKQGGRNRVCIADLDDQAAGVPIVLGEAQQQVESSTLHVLTAAANARDRGTGDHAHRMVALAEATARVLRLTDEQVHLVRLGALLHDIGKIGIPDAILHKPGPLTTEEWDVMRLHPEIGRRILSQAGGVFLALADIVVAHHERWDGCGYPFGLEGENIPLAARILTVIDSYDAMTSRRVYREAMSPLAARAELERCAGSQYDPTIVAAFLRVLDTHDIMGAMLIPVTPLCFAA